MRRGLTVVTLAGLTVMAASLGEAYGLPEKPPRPAALDPGQSLEVSQQAIGGSVGNHRFIEAKGGTVSLGDLSGKPLVISMIYTSCSHVCPMITQRLRQAVAEAQRVLGADRFTVVTIGFDTRNDTPMRMAAYARSQDVNLPNWIFLSADEATVSRLAKDLGFAYAASAGGFVHASQTTIVDRDGRVYRQIYGEDFPIQVFMEPMKEAVFGTVGTFLSIEGLIDRVRFLCTVYDPSQGRYRISYAIAMSFLTGVFALGGTAMVISRMWLSSRRT